MSRDLRDAVVVITGASSGIGRATALALAREGSRLALASRGAPTLREVAQQCRELGAEAEAIVTDVRDVDATERLAAAAVERFGYIDVWVNCAGVIAYGRFEDLPPEVFRGVIETNLLGQANGARAALQRFRAQGDGTIINVSSVWGRMTSPDVSAYVTSKYALRAFSDCLRHEVADAPGIQVATILPQAIDTPIFGQAANYSGRRVRPIPPLLDAEDVARSILQCARSPAREVTLGHLGRVLELVHVAAPRLYARTVAQAFGAGSFARARARETTGNVLRPNVEAERISGDWKRSHRRTLAEAFLATAGAALRGLLPRAGGRSA